MFRLFPKSDSFKWWLLPTTLQSWSGFFRGNNLEVCDPIFSAIRPCYWLWSGIESEFGTSQVPSLLEKYPLPLMHNNMCFHSSQDYPWNSMLLDFRLRHRGAVVGWNITFLSQVMLIGSWLLKYCEITSFLATQIFTMRCYNVQVW